jgi:hypothetical protein
MKRRSRAGSKSIKARRRKASEPKRRNAPKAVARSNSSPAGEETEVAPLGRELNEALERETATSVVLEVISGSPGDPQPVFAAMLENAVRICDAKFGAVYRCEMDTFRFIAMHNAPSDLADVTTHLPFLSVSR